MEILVGVLTWKLIYNLIKIFNPTCDHLHKIIDEGSTLSQIGDANLAYRYSLHLNLCLFCISWKKLWRSLIYFIKDCNVSLKTFLMLCILFYPISIATKGCWSSISSVQRWFCFFSLLLCMLFLYWWLY